MPARMRRVILLFLVLPPLRTWVGGPVAWPHSHAGPARVGYVALDVPSEREHELHIDHDHERCPGYRRPRAVAPNRIALTPAAVTPDPIRQPPIPSPPACATDDQAVIGTQREYVTDLFCAERAPPSRHATV